MQSKWVMPAVIVAFAAMLAAAATPKGMAPLPVQYLTGRTFHSPDGWLRIDVPAGWEWFEMRAFDGKADPRWPDAINQTVAWMARDPKTLDDVMLMETYHPGGDVIERFEDDFESNTRRAIAPDKMAGYWSEWVTISGEKCLHYHYALVPKTGKPLYRFGYAMGMEHRLFVSTSDGKPMEPPWFTQAARSVRWLKMP